MLEQTGDLSREGIVAALERWDGEQAAPGVLPPVTFSDDDHLGLESVYLVRMQDRAFRTVAECSVEGAGSTGEACTPAGDGSNP